MPEPLDHVLLGHAPFRLGRKVHREARRTRARARDDALELALREDVPRIDLLLVVGATLVAEPLKSLPLSLAHDVPQIYVGAAPPVGPLGQHAWDVELIGDCDVCHACMHAAPCRMHAAP